MKTLHRQPQRALAHHATRLACPTSPTPSPTFRRYADPWVLKWPACPSPDGSHRPRRLPVPLQGEADLWSP